MAVLSLHLLQASPVPCRVGGFVTTWTLQVLLPRNPVWRSLSLSSRGGCRPTSLAKEANHVSSSSVSTLLLPPSPRVLPPVHTAIFPVVEVPSLLDSVSLG